MDWRKISGVFAIMIASLALCGYAYLQHPKFGAVAEANRLDRSPNYVDGRFQNLQPDPKATIAEDDQKGWMDMLLGADNGRIPPGPVPAEVTDLKALDRGEDMIVWLGHSSFFIQLAGKRILIDPVLSQNASPVPMTNEAFEGASPFEPDDLPRIDYLLISHDHWDHLDYPTLMALKDRVGDVIVGLGVGEHFRSWGFPKEHIHEADWGTTLNLDEALAIHILPARHYSGRWFEKNQSLWVSFALETADRKVFFSGDSGYGEHFKAIGDRFGEFDLVLLDSGQYDEQWRHIHMTPEDAAQAADDLNAKAFMPAHVGKFSIAFHSWDDPFQRLESVSQGKDWELITPRIGELADIGSLVDASAGAWWQSVRANN